MIIIADAGSTKTTWSLCEAGACEAVRTSGINAATMAPETIAKIIADELLPRVRGRAVTSVNFYGAGIVSDSRRAVIAEALALLSADSVMVESDMLGAARAILGHEAGIVCILGTGSNTCLYDGDRIVDNVPALGYILGDEGSGASLGRRFVGDLFKRMFPDEVGDMWRERVGLDMADVIERVYRSPGANVFLGSLVPMIRELIGVDAVASMVEDEFDRFFIRNIDRYATDCRRLGFIGSVAVNFADVLDAVARRHGYTVAALEADPMPLLVKFHECG